MAAVCNRVGHYIFALWFLSIFLWSPYVTDVIQLWLQCRLEGSTTYSVVTVGHIWQLPVSCVTY